VRQNKLWLNKMEDKIVFFQVFVFFHLNITSFIHSLLKNHEAWSDQTNYVVKN